MEPDLDYEAIEELVKGLLANKKEASALEYGKVLLVVTLNGERHSFVRNGYWVRYRVDGNQKRTWELNEKIDFRVLLSELS